MNIRRVCGQTVWRIRTRRRLRSLLKISLAALIALWITLKVGQAVESPLVFQMYDLLYKLGDLVDSYVRTPAAEFELLDTRYDTGPVVAPERINHKCLMPTLAHDAKLAMNFYQTDAAALASTFAVCGNENERHLDTLIDVSAVSQHANASGGGGVDGVHAYRLRLNVSLLVEWKLVGDDDDSRRQVSCFAQRLDKRINHTEETEEIDMDDTVFAFNTTSLFSSSSGNISDDDKKQTSRNPNGVVVTATVDRNGFYYVYCLLSVRLAGMNAMGYNKKVFDMTLTVFPADMSLLIAQRRQYRTAVEKFIGNSNKHIADKPGESSLIQNEEDQVAAELQAKHRPTSKTQTENDRSNDNNVGNSGNRGNGSDSGSDGGETEESSNVSDINVLIIGIDSLSHNHFRRAMPLTYAYLKDGLDHNIVFDHFSSVGLNTYPNILAMTTGIVEDDSMCALLNVSSEIERYRALDSTYHDHLPFIWSELEQELGHVTMFQEDEPPIATFNYFKKGFRYWPTCVYGRPFWLKYYAIRSGPDKCHYKQPMYDTWLRQIESFVRHMRTSRPRRGYFAFNFLTEYTHAYMAVPRGLDESLARTLRTLRRDALLDNTLLIVHTDHGNRMKFYAYATEMGKLERYLPLLSMRLPTRLVRHPSAPFYANAASNRDKLVSFFDVYQTLRQIKFLNRRGMAASMDAKARALFRANLPLVRTRRGISLLERVPRNRSCADALVAEAYCSCMRHTHLNESQFVAETRITWIEAGELVRDAVNALVAGSAHGSACARFQLQRVVGSKRHSVNELVLYNIVAVLEPGAAWFEASLRAKKRTQQTAVDSDELYQLRLHNKPIRLSLYGNQSHCVSDSLLANYCFCKDLL